MYVFIKACPNESNVGHRVSRFNNIVEIKPKMQNVHFLYLYVLHIFKINLNIDINRSSAKTQVVN